jgi:hypothetical protein
MAEPGLITNEKGILGKNKVILIRGNSSATILGMTYSRWVVLIVSLIGSAVMGAVLMFLAAMADGMSHNSKSMYTLFPYGTILSMRTDWENLGTVLLFIQFPFYALILNLVRPLGWKAIALVLIIAIHVVTVVSAMRPGWH